MGQGFAHERLPEKGTVLLLDTYDLTEILKECQSYASVGYKIASSQHENLKTTLSNAASRINETLIDFNSSPCYVSSATDLLSQQLIDIESAFNNLSFAFKEDLENLRENLSKFSVTLFGRTMAGKSTLMEILTNGDGLSIGNGAQRTTRDVRQYNWNGLEITDVPGIGAFEGEDDEQIAFEAAKKADLILFLITDDAPQAAEAECFGRIMDLGKPVICIMNVKASAPEGKSIKLLTRDIEKRFDMERLNEIRKQFMSYSKQLGQDWGYVPFVYVHLKSAFMSQNTEDPQVKDTLHKRSVQGNFTGTAFFCFIFRRPDFTYEPNHRWQKAVGLVRNNYWWWIIYFGDLCRRVWCGGCRPAWLDRAWGISGRSSWLFDIQK